MYCKVRIIKNVLCKNKNLLSVKRLANASMPTGARNLNIIVKMLLLLKDEQPSPV